MKEVKEDGDSKYLTKIPNGSFELNNIPIGYIERYKGATLRNMGPGFGRTKDFTDFLKILYRMTDSPIRFFYDRLNEKERKKLKEFKGVNNKKIIFCEEEK